MFGSPETTTGGRALKFYSTMRFDVRRIETIKQGDQMLGNRTRVKIVKNKVAPPFKKAEFDIMYGKGISRSGDILDCAVDADIVKKAGSWYSYNGERIGQGRENVKKYLEDHTELMDEIQQKLMEQLNKPEEEQNAEQKEAQNPDGPQASPAETGDAADDAEDEIIADEDGVIVE